MVDRELLETAALEEVCVCQYYDLADTLSETPDKDLLALMSGEIPCDSCRR